MMRIFPPGFNQRILSLALSVSKTLAACEPCSEKVAPAIAVHEDDNLGVDIANQANSLRTVHCYLQWRVGYGCP